jgi:integrase
VYRALYVRPGLTCGRDPYRTSGRPPARPGQTYTRFIRLVKEAGLSHLKLHGLRHMNISLQLEAGVSERIIAMRVGFTSPALIRSTYGHLIGTVGKRAAEATAAMVPGRSRRPANRIPYKTPTISPKHLNR